jgi:excisionase family DNA binding protein
MTQLTTAEAADILGVDVSQVRRLCIRGKLTATRTGRDWMIDKDTTFDAYANSATRTQGRGRPTYAEVQAERDELRRQRDEALRELRSMLHVLDKDLYPDEAMDAYDRHATKLRALMAQYDKEGDA